jgi:hypothetical protein
MLFGHPGSLKTLLTLDLALCVAGGKSWLPGSPQNSDVRAFECTQTPVLIIDADNGQDRTAQRLVALSRGIGVDSDAPLRWICSPSNPPFVARDREAVQEVISAAKEFGAKLIVIDCLLSVSGGANENSSEMGPVMLGLRQIAEETGAAVIVIHHPTKDGKSMRGFGGIEGAIDLSLQVTRKQGEDTITIKPQKVRDQPIPSFSAHFTHKSDQEGELIEGRFYGLSCSAGSQPSRGEEVAEWILTNMEDGMNQTAIVNLVMEDLDIGRPAALKAIKTLEESERLVTRNGHKPNEKLYSKS